LALIAIKTVLQASLTKDYFAERFNMAEERVMPGHSVMDSVIVACLLVVKEIMEGEIVKNMG
jgi:hypothetical protein